MQQENQQQAQNQTVPPGYWKDAEGRLVPEELIKEIDKCRHELVLDLAIQAQNMSQAMAKFKAAAFADIYAFTDLSMEKYGVQHGGKKGNLTLYSYDGRYKVQVAIAEHMVFDERLQAAKALIDECILEWSQGSRAEIQVLVQDAFQTNQAGKINTGRVLSLSRLDIKDDKWQQAMTAINDSLQVVGSKSYVRFYERIGNTDQYQPISLDVAAL